MQDIIKKAKKIKAVAFDCDGVFFTGRVFIHPKDGEFLKERSLVDGQGISLLRAYGIRIAFVTAEKTGFIEKVCEKLNSLSSVKDNSWPKITLFTGQMGHEKVEVIGYWLNEIGVLWEELGYMGDDLSDYEIFDKVGLAAVPNQAEEIMKKKAHFVASRKGGDGAIRDFANFILTAHKIDIISLARS